MAGATQLRKWRDNYQAAIDVSIHAPARWPGRREELGVDMMRTWFQSTPRHDGRGDLNKLANSTDDEVFQSTPRHDGRGDCFESHQEQPTLRFNPRPGTMAGATR